MIANITAFLLAATTALRVFPLWLSWHLSEQLEKIQDEIITLENLSLAVDRPKLDRLRVKQANGRKQYAALLAIINLPEGGANGKNN